jgi:aryl-alcohol dehydrogenase-like predicted oxidoreductase
MTELLKYGRVDVNQLPYNLLWRAIEYEVLPLCKEQEVGIACYSPLMHGLLTGKFKDGASVPDCRARTRHFSSAHKQIRHHESGQEEATFQAIDEIRAIAAEVGCPMAELALAWLIQRPGVSTVIAGARSPEQMKANAKAMERTLSQDVMERLDKATASLKAAFGANPDMWQSGSDTRYR